MSSLLRGMVLCALCLGLPSWSFGESDYLILVDAGPDGDYRPAADRLAKLHRATVAAFDPGDLPATLALLRREVPRFVVFVLPPSRIDVELSHAILELATQVDRDPFVDFEYGFVTGRNGEAATRFVSRIEAAWKRSFARKGAMFGAWEGATAPVGQPLTAMKTIGFEFEQAYVLTADSEAEREAAARAALRSFRSKDLLLFFSHGYPDRMVGCYDAQDLRDWKVQFEPSILINCACYNGAPGRWYTIGAGGRFEDQGLVAADESVALQVLDSGIAGFFGGIDPWHGPLANQLFGFVSDDGLRLGAAQKAMHDRLALAFLPERIHFPPTASVVFEGEGQGNRRRNGAGMIFYGDPALAPFADGARPRSFARWEGGPGKRQITLGFERLQRGAPGADFMVVQARLMDYYSVQTSDITHELKMEIHRVLPLPAEFERAPTSKVISARSPLGGEIPIGDPQCVIEETPDGRLLHVRVPIDVPIFPPTRLMQFAGAGVTVTLEVER